MPVTTLCSSIQQNCSSSNEQQMRCTHHKVAPEHLKILYRDTAFHTDVHSVCRVGATMRRRTGRKIKSLRAQAAFERTCIRMNANMIDETVFAQKRHRTVWTWKFSILQMRFYVFRKSSIAIKRTWTMLTTERPKICMRIKMSNKIQLVNVRGIALVALELPATRTTETTLLWWLGVRICEGCNDTEFYADMTLYS